MIDLSDGLASDLYHICKMNQVGALIKFDALPFTADVQEVSRICGVGLEHLLLHSGEDYELLFTVNEAISEMKIRNVGKKFMVPITLIGNISPISAGYRITDRMGKAINLNPHGWDHFNNQG
jgi:thiamine-monophosphate kinase